MSRLEYEPFYGDDLTPAHTEVILVILTNTYGVEWDHWKPAREFFAECRKVIGKPVPQGPWGHPNRASFLKALEREDLCELSWPGRGPLLMRLTPLTVYLAYNGRTGEGYVPPRPDGTVVPLWQDLDEHERDIASYIEDFLEPLSHRTPGR